MRWGWITLPRILCLLLCSAIAYLWARSYRTCDEWLLIYRTDGCERASALNGDFMIRHERPLNGTYGGFQRIVHRSDRVGALPPRPWHDDLLQTRWLVFRYINIPASPRARAQRLAQTQAALLVLIRKGTLTVAERQQMMNLQMTVYQLQRWVFQETYWEVVFPLWLLMAAVVVPFATGWTIMGTRHWRRLRRGLCTACGYDLRATVGACPECGRRNARAQPAEAQA